MQGVRQELIASVIDHVEHTLKGVGIDAEKAASIAVLVADNLVDTFGGQNICFPTDYRRKMVQKEALIYSQFRGDNLADLAKVNGMTERGMRKLLARATHRTAKGARA